MHDFWPLLNDIHWANNAQQREHVRLSGCSRSWPVDQNNEYALLRRQVQVQWVQVTHLLWWTAESSIRHQTGKSTDLQKDSSAFSPKSDQCWHLQPLHEIDICHYTFMFLHLSVYMSSKHNEFVAVGTSDEVTGTIAETSESESVNKVSWWGFRW